MSAVTDAGLVQLLLLALHTVCALTAASHALLHKRDSRSAWGWIATCWLFPLAGALLYYLFGINRLHERARQLLGATRLGVAVDEPGPRLLSVVGVDPVELRELVRIGGAMTGLPLSFGNRVEILHNGDEAYPAMLHAITGAERTIYLCTYIFEAGETGKHFVRALVDAHARGVQVRVLVDGMSEVFFASPARRQLIAQGVPAARFLPPRLFPPMLHVNLRNHRKLLLVDGRIGFTGGMNIRDCHVVIPLTARSTADLHFRVTGPVIEQLEDSFLGDWRLATGEVLPRSASSPVIGDAACRAITNGPNDDDDKLVMILMGALANAHQRALIMTPYFIPSLALVAALQSAALRGVEVHIVLPARSNLRYVDWASKKFLEQLLPQQVCVWLQPAPFAHTKLFLIDDYYAQIGSANMDQRSLRLNFELVLEVFDRPLVMELARHFDGIRAASTPLRLHDLAARSLAERLRDSVCWLFSPYL
ncbi:MAG: phospholipase D-like domain-containing protein [Panacagrimonas sp.]